MVADLTDQNANVFYEVGIAHQLKNPRQVVLISQRGEDVPFDLQSLRYLEYQHNDDGRQSLETELRRYLEEALTESAPESWEPIHGLHERTRRIFGDLKAMSSPSAGQQDLSGMTIRVIAGLSSVAISNHEPPPSDPVEAEYNELLKRERDTYRELLVAGANLKAVLNPPTQYAPGRDWRRLDIRYQRLIGLLEGRSDQTNPVQATADLAMMKQCEFVVTEIPHPNTLILGDVVVHEGIKRGSGRGFEMTYRITVKSEVRRATTDFEDLFNKATQRSLSESNDLRQAAITQLKELHKKYLSSCPR
jgi:hypothetical protein